MLEGLATEGMLAGKRRHSIYLAIDIWSRRVRVLVLVTRSPRAEAVAMLLRACILAWGVPRRVKTEKGSDFKAKSISRLFAAMQIEHELSAPYEPKSKGNVERAIGTFQRDLATCPGFIGHSVADRKVIESRKAFSKRLGMSELDLFTEIFGTPVRQTTGLKSGIGSAMAARRPI
ncbi:transposase [Rhodobacter capsulatus]|uniref:transposase n=1 Tax=Rhodobacter capsulatus TaxID=1061 RepID=UPI0040298F33